ncbi:MAG: hypothetical protein ACE5HU_07400, partial [Acidobacteriota bacterium]
MYTPVVPAPASPANGPAAPGFLFYPDVSADVIVESTSRGAAVRSGPGYRPDPFFEEAYETAFINYDRNRSLRGGPGGAPVVAGLSGAAAATAPPVGSRLFGSAATPVYRLIVREDGIYRLTYSYLLDPVTGVAPGLAGVDPATFKLMNKGVEVPIRVVTAVAGTFAPGDFIEFFGEGLLDEPDLLLNFDFDTLGQPLQPDIFQANDFTDENVYFLTVAAADQPAMPERPSAPAMRTPPDHFQATARVEVDDAYRP